MRSFAVFFVVVTMLAVPSKSDAWGKTGHRVTGEIATRYLSRNSKKQITRILGVEDLAEASTWADFMRSNPEPFWQRTANPYHYVTIPVGQRYADVTPPAKGDAITALSKFSATLRDKDASLEDRQRALRLIVHIVGDLHQPLHAGNGTDRGGNEFTVVYAGNVTNLHYVWDSALVDEEALSYTEYAAWLLRRMTPEQVKTWSVADPAVWVDESAEIRDTIYPTGDRNLSWAYFYAHRDTVRRRLSQGGVRMAAFLNAVFDD